LLRYASAQKPKQNPAKNGSDACKENTPSFHENNSSQQENAYENEKRGKKNVRRSISRNRGMQAESDAAGKCRGDRYSRQPHDNLRNLTKVSM
jgi:hypothetical protein